MLVQGIGAGKHVEASFEPVPLAGARATALALVFGEYLQNALEHGGEDVRIEEAARAGTARSSWRSRTRDQGARAGADGTGLSIVRALVRDQMNGRFELRSGVGTRAEVTFPA